MKTSKSRWMGMAAGLMMGVAAVQGASDCPKPNNNDGGDNDDQSAQDPVFLLSEKKPAVSAKEKLGQLNQQGAGKTAVSGEQEKTILQGYEAVRGKDARQVYGKVLEIWGQEVSPELKQYVILSSLPVVKSTDEVQTLKFMLSALENVETRVQELTVLAKGNGLEKAKAARLLSILNRNPQFKI